MNRFIALVVCLVSALALPTAQARADYIPFGQYSSFEIEPDGDSHEYASVFGRNALPTSVGCFVNAYEDQGKIYIAAGMHVHGGWTPPDTSGPQIDFLVEHGYQVNSYFSQNNITVNGHDWIFETPVSINLNGHVGLYQDLEFSFLEANMNMSIYTHGVMPTSITTTVQFNHWTNPGEQDTWDVDMNATFLVVGAHQVPTPGSLALLGFAGLVGRRRRR